MKFQMKAIAAGVALGISNGAFAASTPLADNAVFVGGATAPQEFLREDTIRRICDPAATIRVFVDEQEGLPEPTDTTDGLGAILSHGDQQVIYCANTRGTLPAPLANQELAIYKFNGGSATGVAPVVDPDTAQADDKQFLNVVPSGTGFAGCNRITNAADTTAPTGNWPILGPNTGEFELWECPTAPKIAQSPDAGISDIEPQRFTGPLALNFGEEPIGVQSAPTNSFVDQGNLVVSAGPGLIFGTAVTLPMYNELVDDQVDAGLLPADCASGAGSSQSDRDAIRCMPSLPSSFIRSVFGGQITSWADASIYGQTLDPVGAVTRGNEVHICKRTNGSGTHAEFAIEYLGTNCTATESQAMAEVNDGFASTTAGIVGVFANSGSSDMDDCLRALGSGDGFDGDFAAAPDFDYTDGVTPDVDGDSSIVPGPDVVASIPALSGVTRYSRPLGSGNPVQADIVKYGDAFSAYAMGYNSLEKNTGLDLPYRFVKVDHVAPTLENAISGDYSQVYYLSFQYRTTGSDSNGVSGLDPDLRTDASGIRTGTPDATDVEIAEAYFNVWAATDPAAIQLVNFGEVVDPDGSPDILTGGGDDWATGYVTTVAGADTSFDPIPANGDNAPETPFSRQNSGGEPDSCQAQSLVR